MKRVAIIGNVPLPTQNTKSRPAAGLRTYQFLKPLLKDGAEAVFGEVDDKVSSEDFSEKSGDYTVLFIGIAMPECYGEEGLDLSNEENAQVQAVSDKFSKLIVSKDNPKLFSLTQASLDDFHPDAVIGVNTYPSYVVSGLKFSAPFWADLNGWIMAEAQAQAYKTDSNDYIGHYFDMEQSILLRADKFSTVSEAQKLALLGELACFGRFGKESFGYDFAKHIPNATEWFSDEQERAFNGEKRKNVESIIFSAGIQEKIEKIPASAVKLLFMGGYNTWVDEITLFLGLEDAMRECKDLYFISTGGVIEGLDNKTFAKFREMIDKSEFRDRFVFLGWVSTNDIPYIYRYADCGLNVDRKCVETLTGARNRINEMMKFGLPIITTLGSEISYEVLECGAGICVGSGNHRELTEAIVRMYKEKKGGEVKFAAYGAKGMKYISEKCNYSVVMRPLFRWLENPRQAPDKGNLKTGRGGIFGCVWLIFGRFWGPLRAGLRYLKMNGFKKFFKKVWQRARR